MAEEKPKERRRLLVDPNELGITGRIRKALLEREMGLTQRIQSSMNKVIRNKESDWHLGKYQLVVFLILVLLLVGFGYLGLRTRTLNLEMIHPNGEKVPTSISLAFWQTVKDIKVPPYKRQIEYYRTDIYGSDLDDEKDFVILSKGEPVKNPRLLPPGDYTLRVKKPGFKKEEKSISIGEVKVRIPVELTPEEQPKRKLQIFLNDPMLGDKLLEPDDVRLKDENNTSIKDVAIKPGHYLVVIHKAGYHPKEMKLFIPEDGVVKEKITLDYKDRAVKFLVDDGLSEPGHEPEVRPEEITLIRDGQEVEYQGNLLPAYYDLTIKRDGYYTYKDRIKVIAGADLLTFRIPLKTMDREIVIQPHYDISPSEPKPDKAYLKKMTGSKEVIPITEGLKVAPQRYWITIEKADYKPVHQEIFIRPGSTSYVFKAHLIAMSKLLIMKIRSDFEEEPSVNPDFLDISMDLGKKGYRVKNRERLKQSLPPEKKEIGVLVELETIPREVIAEVSSDITAGMIDPDVMTLTRIRRGKPEGQSVDIRPRVHRGIKFKPARYLLNIQKTGFEPIEEEIIIYPSPDPYVIKRKLTAKKRLLVLEVDTDYAPGEHVQPDAMFINQEVVEPGIKLKPGKYRLRLRKSGYYEIEKGINVLPGSEAFIFKDQFKAKKRLLVYNIIGAGLKKVEPDVVSFDENEVRENTYIPPKQVYKVKIQKKGYVVWTKNITVEPSEKEFILNATLTPLKRKIILVLTASFPPGQDLTPADKCMLGNIAVTSDTEVVPDKYNLVIVKTGYKTINRTVNIEPDEVPYKIVEVMYPKARPIVTEVKYAVAPEDPKLKWTARVESESIPAKFLQKEDQIEPQNYTLEISAPGYTTLREKITILPSETTYYLQKTLEPEPRQLVIHVSADYPAGEIFADKILLDGNSVPTESRTARVEIKPGKHSLFIDKAGYQSLSKEIFIPGGVGDYDIHERLVCQPRVVEYLLTDAETGKQLVPDSITLDKVPVTGSSPFKPKHYQLEIKLEGYETQVEKIEIPPGEGPFTIKRKMIPASRIVQYEITGDFSNETLTPEEITLNGEPVDGIKKFRPGGYDLKIYVPGYERKQDKIIIKPSRDIYTIRQMLVSKKRKLVFDINSSFDPNMKLTPDKVTFANKSVVEGEEIKPIPGGYQVVIEKEGYMPFSQNIIIRPCEDDFVLKVTLQARPRRIIFTLDSDWKPGVEIEADKIRLNGKEFGGEPVVPAKYDIQIMKVGYEMLSFEETVPPGSKPYEIKKTLIAKPRPVVVTVISDFSNETMEPEVLHLADKDINENQFKPGVYELVIYHPGYEERREKIEVPPGEGAYKLERRLIPKKRLVKPKVRFDILPPEDLPPHTIHIRSMETGETWRLMTPESFKPGFYVVNVEKEGYETLTRKIVIPPDELPYELDLELIAKNVQILIEITYDIQPPKGHQPFTVTFVDVKTGIGRNVTHGKRIRPGHYFLEIAQAGYEFKPKRKKVYVPPGTKPFWIKEKLFAKKRQLSFEMIHEGKLVRAEQIFLNGEPVKVQDTFKPGHKYKMIAKFKGFNTVQKDIIIPPGEGPHVIDVALTKLSQYEFRIGKKYAASNGGIFLDGVQYKMEIYVDGIQVEPHQIEFEEEGPPGLKVGFFYAPKHARLMRIVAGFYYGESLIKPINSFRDLKRIDANLLIGHLRDLAGRAPITVLRRLEQLLRDPQDLHKVKALPLTDRERLINLLRDLNLTTESDLERRKRLISKLSK